MFRKLQQGESESLDNFHVRLRSKAKNCEFANIDAEIEQQIIVGGSSSHIRKKALKDPEYKLKDMLIDGRRKEYSSYQSKEIEGRLKPESEIVDKVSANNRAETKKCFNCGGEFPKIF